MMRKRLTLITALGLVLIAAAGAAAIPGPDGAVVACYEPANAQKGGSAGPLRPVDPSR